MFYKNKFSQKRFENRLRTRYIGRNTVYQSVCKSTNLTAKSQCDMPDGTVFVAARQTNGRGRLGRDWSSAKGGIYMSVLLKPDIDAEIVSQLTLIAAIAVCRAIGIDAQIKWPNDIVVNDRKVCGILTEMSADADGNTFIVCGIGINVNIRCFPNGLPYAGSLRRATGKTWDISHLTADVMNELENVLDTFTKHGFTAVADEYKSRCVNLNREVTLTYGNRSVCGTVTDVLPNGELAVNTADGVITAKSGEVSVRGLYGYV